MTPQSAATTIRALYAEHRALYGSVPTPDIDTVCPVCLGVKGPTFASCAGCMQARLERHIATGTSSVLVPLSTAFESGDEPQAAWYRALREYKRTEASFDEHHLKVVALLGMGLHTHRDRLANLLGGPADIVTVVPSSRPHLRDAAMLRDQPLCRVLGRLQFLGDVLRPLLAYRDGKLRNEVRADAFECVDPAGVSGKRVVLVDDTWVSGAGAASARECLLAAGAAAVVIVVAARVVRPSYADEVGAIEYLSHAMREHAPDYWPR